MFSTGSTGLFWAFADLRPLGTWGILKTNNTVIRVIRGLQWELDLGGLWRLKHLHFTVLQVLQRLLCLLPSLLGAPYQQGVSDPRVWTEHGPTTLSWYLLGVTLSSALLENRCYGKVQ